ncbi:unnamed protein product [Cercopithifilaria johnstoni]|uniref:Uncharacterized protein n=1 Tax=Cercopithifilaria johnstoni TaxID=2874296 RepID=A0A8J2QB80_9BILA|nr:unnamed protein product [Cercopithifilaria johnstoni]
MEKGRTSLPTPLLPSTLLPSPPPPHPFHSLSSYPIVLLLLEPKGIISSGMNPTKAPPSSSATSSSSSSSSYKGLFPDAPTIRLIDPKIARKTLSQNSS